MWGFRRRDIFEVAIRMLNLSTSGCDQGGVTVIWLHWSLWRRRGIIDITRAIARPQHTVASHQANCRWSRRERWRLLGALWLRYSPSLLQWRGRWWRHGCSCTPTVTLSFDCIDSRIIGRFELPLLLARGLGCLYSMSTWNINRHCGFDPGGATERHCKEVPCH